MTKTKKKEVNSKSKLQDKEKMEQVETTAVSEGRETRASFSFVRRGLEGSDVDDARGGEGNREKKIGPFERSRAKATKFSEKTWKQYEGRTEVSK